MNINDKLINKLGLYRAMLLTKMAEKGACEFFVFFGRREIIEDRILSRDNISRIYRNLTQLHQDGILEIQVDKEFELTKRCKYRITEKGLNMLSSLGLSAPYFYMNKD